MRASALLVFVAATTASLVSGCSGCSNSPPEAGDFACLNARDDDGDGLTDCDDPGCATVAVCRSITDAGPGGDVGRIDAGPFDAGPPVTCVDPIDLVFVLDVSTSMAGEADALRMGVSSIFAAADALTTDHRFGLVVFVDDALAVEGCRNYATAAELSAELSSWQTFCSSNRNPVNTAQMNSDCAENTLDAMWVAASTCTWRPGATHVLIHVTDDTFEEPPYVYSGGPFGGGIPAMRAYYEVRDRLIASEIRVGAFAMAVPEACGAGMSADTGRGFFTDYGALQSFPVATGGRAWNLREVRDGTLDMATAIAEMIEDEHCTVF